MCLINLLILISIPWSLSKFVEDKPGWIVQSSYSWWLYVSVNRYEQCRSPTVLASCKPISRGTTSKQLCKHWRTMASIQTKIKPVPQYVCTITNDQVQGIMPLCWKRSTMQHKSETKLSNVERNKEERGMNTNSIHSKRNSSVTSTEFPLQLSISLESGWKTGTWPKTEKSEASNQQFKLVFTNETDPDPDLGPQDFHLFHLSKSHHLGSGNSWNRWIQQRWGALKT